MHVFREGGVAKLMRERRDDCEVWIEIEQVISVSFGIRLQAAQITLQIIEFFRKNFRLSKKSIRQALAGRFHTESKLGIITTNWAAR